uniref:hypothetical protein n=1 Tax=Acetatifactor sp. TaxID=1872090 RepID=UPI0040562B5C
MDDLFLRIVKINISLIFTIAIIANFPKITTCLMQIIPIEQEQEQVQEITRIEAEVVISDFYKSSSGSHSYAVPVGKTFVMNRRYTAAEYKIYVLYNGEEHSIDDYELYHAYNGRIGDTAIGVFVEKTDFFGKEYLKLIDIKDVEQNE